MLFQHVRQWRRKELRPSAKTGRSGGSVNSQKVGEVFLLAENRLLREALIRLLTKRSDIRVVGANAYSPAVHEEIITARPDIIVLDSSGLVFSNAQLIPTLHAAIPDLRVVMIDMDS